MTVGIDGYKAPEILGLTASTKASSYDEKCDMWSYGCVVFEMLTKKLPFPSLQDLNNFCISGTSETMTEILHDSPGSWPFVASLLQPNPSERSSALKAQDALSYWLGPVRGQSAHLQQDTTAWEQQAAPSRDSFSFSEMVELDSTPVITTQNSPPSAQRTFGVLADTINRSASYTEATKLDQAPTRAAAIGAEVEHERQEDRTNPEAATASDYPSHKMIFEKYSAQQKIDVAATVEQSQPRNPLDATNQPTARQYSGLPHSEQIKTTSDSAVLNNSRIKAERIRTSPGGMPFTAPSKVSVSSAIHNYGDASSRSQDVGVMFARLRSSKWDYDGTEPGGLIYSDLTKKLWYTWTDRFSICHGSQAVTAFPMDSYSSCVGLCPTDEITLHVEFRARYVAFRITDYIDLSSGLANHCASDITRVTYRVFMPDLRDFRSSSGSRLKSDTNLGRLELAILWGLHVLDPSIPHMFENVQLHDETKVNRRGFAIMALHFTYGSTLNDAELDKLFPYIRCYIALNQSNLTIGEYIRSILKSYGLEVSYESLQSAVQRWNVEYLVPRKKAPQSSSRCFDLSQTEDLSVITVQERLRQD